VLSLGSNYVNWVADQQDIFTSSTTTCGLGSAVGPDLVLAYQASQSGYVDVTIEHPAGAEWAVLLSNMNCGTTGQLNACVPATGPGTQSSVSKVPVLATTPLWIYVTNTSGSTAQLANPLTVTVALSGP
jgi:hypothetical protein